MGSGGFRFGAGRPGWHVKAEQCLRLDVRELARRGVLSRAISTTWSWSNSYTGERSGSIWIVGHVNHLDLQYRIDDTPLAQHVSVVRTACTFGGARPWLLCPRCSKRVGVLYMRGGRFVCRHCGGVRYSSQSEDRTGRSWRLQQRLERRLDDDWARPKGMHLATHRRIIERLIACEHVREQALEAFIRQSPLLRGLVDQR